MIHMKLQANWYKEKPDQWRPTTISKFVLSSSYPLLMRERELLLQRKRLLLRNVVSTSKA